MLLKSIYNSELYQDHITERYNNTISGSYLEGIILNYQDHITEKYNTELYQDHITERYNTELLGLYY